MRSAGLQPGTDLTVRRFDVGVGLHGDHIGGERDAARALLAGEVAAACMIDGNHLLFGREGTLPAGATRVLAQTGRYDHCNMTVVDTAPQDLVARFVDLLLSMSYADSEVRPLLDLEGLTAWREGRDTGYAALASSGLDRWVGARRAGGPAVSDMVTRPAPEWGPAARGALIEAGGPAVAGFDIAERDVVWADLAPRLYARAAAELGTSSVGGRASLATLLTEPDFSLASFLLSVLGEGSFLNLLTFLDRHAPDPVTRQVTRLARQDEARHVAFGVAHLEHQSMLDPTLRGRLRAAVERRHDALADTAGLNEDVFDSLMILAAGSWAPAAISLGYRAVQELQQAMDEGRQQRLLRLGFPADEAAELSALHTRNFM